MKKIILILLCSLLVGSIQANIITDPIVNGLKFATWCGVGAVVPVVGGYYGDKIGKSVCNTLGLVRPEIGIFYADKVVGAGLGLVAAYCAKRIMHKGAWVPTFGLATGVTCGAPMLVAAAYLINRLWPRATAPSMAAAFTTIDSHSGPSAYDVPSGQQAHEPQNELPEQSATAWFYAKSVVEQSAYDYLFSQS